MENWKKYNHVEPLKPAEWNYDGSAFFTREGSVVTVWSIQGKVLRQLKHDNAVSSAYWRPDGEGLLTVSNSNEQPKRRQVRIWPGSGEYYTLRDEKDVQAVAWSSDGARIASVYGSNSDGSSQLVLWDMGGTVFDWAVRDSVRNSLDILKLLLDECESLKGMFSSTFFHELCYTAKKLRNVDENKWERLMVLISILVEKEGVL